MQLDDFDYALPAALIAQHPPARRRDARLLALEPGAALRDLTIADLPALLLPGDLVVLNDTRVIPARLYGRKESGGAVEILIERVLAPYRALAHVRASKAPKPGTRCLLDPAGTVTVMGREGDLFVLESDAAEPFDALLGRAGHVPLPPYIERSDEVLDSERYQTVFATRPGAVAAPTAGLHLDDALLATIKNAGIEVATLTLHVGAGTFQPVRTDTIEAHVMHAERFEIPPPLCAALKATQERRGRVVAIGTTVARALESAALEGLPIRPMRGETQLFIRPGFEFRAVDVLLTNFHLPRSTLLMLVSAFGGHEQVLAAYRHAVAHRYRFFSYGDAMWLPRYRVKESLNKS